MTITLTEAQREEAYRTTCSPLETLLLTEFPWMKTVLRENLREEIVAWVAELLFENSQVTLQVYKNMEEGSLLLTGDNVDALIVDLDSDDKEKLIEAAETLGLGQYL